jgi:hypothetical protein
MAAPNVCLLTAYNAAYQAVAEITVPHMRSLADRFGYRFVEIRRDDCTRRGGWIKIEPICAALREDFDFVLWLDADALIVRTDRDVRTAVTGEFDLYMTWHDTDASPQARSFIPHYNSGVMLIRASDWARDFFAQVWEVGQLCHIWADQASIHHLLGYDDVLLLGDARPGEPRRSRVDKLDLAWNSIPGVMWASDPVIHHYAGLHQQARLRLLQADASTIPLRATANPAMRETLTRQLCLWAEDVNNSARIALYDELRADNDRRAQQIETLTRLLRESEADRTARWQQIQELTALLKQSDTDRAARFEQIKTLDASLRESEADRAARHEQIQTLIRWLKESEAAATAGRERIATLEARVGELEAQAAAAAERNRGHRDPAR